MKIKSEHSETKFLKLNEDKKWMMYMNEKLKQFEIIKVSVSINAKFTISAEIITDLKLTKKHEFKKLKKSISESDFVDVQLFDVKNTIFADDTLQTSSIMNQQMKIIISDYHLKTSKLSDDDWRKISKKCKCTSEDNDKESLLIRRQCKKHAWSDTDDENKKKIKMKSHKEESAELVINLWKKKLKKMNSKLKLIKKLKTMNLIELWWKYHLICSALSHVQMKVTHENEMNTANEDDTVKSV